ncbi:MAG: 30S ribosomal protein S20 [Patescibacteria group bacterium]
MPIKEASKKDRRQTVKRTTHNLQIKTKIELLGKQIKKALGNKNIAEAEKIFKELQKSVDKAVKIKIFKKNKVNRIKSQVTKRINTLKKK